VTGLLDLVVVAHSRSERRGHINAIDSDMSITGGLWTSAHTRKQRISHCPFTAERKQSRYTPADAAIEILHRDISKGRPSARWAFKGHTLETARDDLDLARFSGFAFQKSPFLFTTPGFEVEELPPVDEKKEFRHLATDFANSIAAHCPEQVCDVDSRNVSTRMHCFSQVTDGAPVAHSLPKHKNVDATRFASKRRALPGNPDDTADRYRVPVAMDLAEIQLS